MYIWNDGDNIQEIHKTPPEFIAEYEDAVIRGAFVESCRACQHAVTVWHVYFPPLLALCAAAVAPQFGYPNGFVDGLNLTKTHELPVIKYLVELWHTAKLRRTVPLSPPPVVPPGPKKRASIRKKSSSEDTSDGSSSDLRTRCVVIR